MNPVDPIAKKSRDVFDQAVDTLDTATINRLRLMRRDTLATPTKKSLLALQHWMLPAAGFATLALVLSMTLFFPSQQNDTSLNAYDSALILSEDDTDEEMLSWLADAPVEVSPAAKGSL
jgi:hypothetical protein